MNIREKMSLEFKDKTIFKQVQDYSLNYLDEVGNRDVYPSKDSLAKLDNLSEKRPYQSREAKEVLEFLKTKGARK